MATFKLLYIPVSKEPLPEKKLAEIRLPPTRLPVPGNVKLPTLSKVQENEPAAIVVLAPVPIKLPADILPEVVILPVVKIVTAAFEAK